MIQVIKNPLPLSEIQAVRKWLNQPEARQFRKVLESELLQAELALADVAWRDYLQPDPLVRARKHLDEVQKLRTVLEVLDPTRESWNTVKIHID